MTQPLGALSPALLRKTFGRFPSGVTAICGIVCDRPVGMAVSSFTPVSLDPPLVSICIGRTSKSWVLLRGARNLGISVLSAAQGAACRQLSSQSDSRFAGIAWRRGEGESLFIERAAAWLDCSIEREIDAGDHTIVLLSVNAIGADPEILPLVFHDSSFVSITGPVARTM